MRSIMNPDVFPCERKFSVQTKLLMLSTLWNNLFQIFGMRTLETIGTFSVKFISFRKYKSQRQNIQTLSGKCNVIVRYTTTSLSSVYQSYFQGIRSFSTRFAVFCSRHANFCGRYVKFHFLYKIKPFPSGYMETFQVDGRTVAKNYISATKSSVSTIKTVYLPKKLQIHSNSDTET